MESNNSTVLGVDIGGSHITAALVDQKNCVIISDTLQRAKINSREEAGKIIGSWSEVLRKVSNGNIQKQYKIGIAMPGPFDYQKGISWIKNQGKFDHLYGCNIKELLSAELLIEPDDILLMNDAASFLKGEVSGGIARGFSRAIGVTLGTGLGTAKYQSHNAEDADLWKLPFKNGIAEDYLCTRWFVSRYKELSGQRVEGVKELITSETAENPYVEQVFKEFGYNLANFLVIFMKEAEAEVVVLGGNISNSHELFLPWLEKGLTEYGINIPVKRAMLGEEAALIGAACSWRDRL